MNASAFYELCSGKPKRITDEKLEGVLINIFGIQMPKDSIIANSRYEKEDGLLENVFGLKMQAPSSQVTPAYSLILQWYAGTADDSKS